MNVKFPEQWCKINKLKFKKMVVIMGNVSIDIPLFLPVEYKQEYNCNPKYWIYGTEALMQ